MADTFVKIDPAEARATRDRFLASTAKLKKSNVEVVALLAAGRLDQGALDAHLTAQAEFTESAGAAMDLFADIQSALDHVIELRDSEIAELRPRIRHLEAKLARRR